MTGCRDMVEALVTNHLMPARTGAQLITDCAARAYRCQRCS